MNRIIALCSIIWLAMTINVKAQGSEKPNVTFFVNYGRTEITELNCYDFDNLMMVIEVKPEMFAYDEITIGIYVSPSVINSISFSKSVFRAKYAGKKHIYFWVFTDLSSSNRSELKDPYLNRPYRSEWQFGYKDEMENFYAKVLIKGSDVSGYKENYDASTQSYIKEPIYSHTNLLNKSILKLNNRIQRKFGKRYDNVQASQGDCYPYDGTKEISNIYLDNNANGSSSNTTQTNNTSELENVNQNKKEEKEEEKAKHGPFEEVSNNGTYIIKGEYDNGKKTGKWTKIENGVVRREEEFKDDLLHGKKTEYNSSGTKIREENYVTGKKNGESIKYNINKGTLEHTQTYKDDALDGPYKKYGTDGILREEGNYVKGMKDGVWKTYDTKGKLTKTQKFKNGIIEQ